MASASAQEARPTEENPSETQAEHGGTDIAELDKQAIAFVQAGDFAAAEPLVASIIELSLRDPNQHAQAAEILKSYAFVVRKLGTGVQAIAAWERLVALTVLVFGEDHADTVNRKRDFGSLLAGLGQLNKAEQLQREALAAAGSIYGESDSRSLEIDSNLALTLARKGAYVEAEKKMAAVLRKYRRFYGENDDAVIDSLNNYAFILDLMGRNSEALPLYKEAAERYEKQHGPDKLKTLGLMGNYASALLNSGEIDLALGVFEELLEKQVRLVGAKSPEAQITRNNLAVALTRAKHWDRAYAVHREALKIDREIYGDDHPKTFVSFNNYAHFLADAGAFKNAVIVMSKALGIGRKLYGFSHPDVLKSAVSLTNWHMLSEEHRDYAFDMALFVGGELRRRWDKLGHDPRGEGQFGLEATKYRFFFELAAEASWIALQGQESGRVLFETEAFAAMQDAITGTTTRALALSAARRLAEQEGGHGELARERQGLADEWLDLERQLVSRRAENAPKEQEKLSLRLREIDARLGAIDKILEEEAGDYFSLIRPRDLKTYEVQRLLQPDEAAILLLPMDFATHVMLVTREGISWERSDWTRNKIDAAVTRLLWDVGGSANFTNDQAAQWGDEGEGVYPFDFDTAHALYQQLVAPLETQLKNKSHLFVVASGSLANLPLGILVSEVPSGANGDPETLRSAKWLADQIALIQTPSLQSIKYLREDRSDQSAAKRTPFVGFGDPLLEGESTQRGMRNREESSRSRGLAFDRLLRSSPTDPENATTNVDQLKSLSRLPGTAVELKALWEAFGAPAQGLFLASSATEPNVRQANLQAEVISFATHGLLAGEIEGAAEPGLVLTPPAQARIDDDGYLSMSEIAALKMDSDWVILSACNTASGDGSSNSSGLSGLARAFFYAGARNLLVSHWPVRDDVAAQLTVETIKAGQDQPSLSRAQALQQAMQKIRNDPSADSDTDTWAHPNAWAPFILVGDR